MSSPMSPQQDPATGRTKTLFVSVSERPPRVPVAGSFSGLTWGSLVLTGRYGVAKTNPRRTRL